MTHVTYRLTAKNRDQLRNPTLGNRVWATFYHSIDGTGTVCVRFVPPSVRVYTCACQVGAFSGLPLTSSLRTPVIFCVMNADSGRYADTPVMCVVVRRGRAWQPVCAMLTDRRQDLALYVTPTTPLMLSTACQVPTDLCDAALCYIIVNNRLIDKMT